MEGDEISSLTDITNSTILKTTNTDSYDKSTNIKMIDKLRKITKNVKKPNKLVLEIKTNKEDSDISTIKSTNRHKLLNIEKLKEYSQAIKKNNKSKEDKLSNVDNNSGSILEAPIVQLPIPIKQDLNFFDYSFEEQLNIKLRNDLIQSKKDDYKLYDSSMFYQSSFIQPNKSVVRFRDLSESSTASITGKSNYEHCDTSMIKSLIEVIKEIEKMKK